MLLQYFLETFLYKDAVHIFFRIFHKYYLPQILTPLDVIFVLIFGIEHRLWNSSVRYLTFSAYREMGAYIKRSATKMLCSKQMSDLFIRDILNRYTSQCVK
jgi:hypothetical protein